MKKIALTSLLAVAAVSGANAANVIDGNPLYRPDKGHFYSETTLSTHSLGMDAYGLGEEFGYGVTDKLSVAVGLGLAERDWFENYAWNSMAFGLNYRVLDRGMWMADVYGEYDVGGIWAKHGSFMKKANTNYAWLVGTRAGFTQGAWTVAGHVDFTYANTESFNWDDDGIHTLDLGLDAQYVLDSHWNFVGGVEYHAFPKKALWNRNLGSWTGMLGANYNFDATKYVGAYIERTLGHVAEGAWEVLDGFGMGVKFGIDF